MNLKEKMRIALAKTTSKSPLDTAALAEGHHFKSVLAVLEEMALANEVCWCQITKGGTARVVWWHAGNVGAVVDPFHIKPTQDRLSAPPKNRMSEQSKTILACVKDHPGSTSLEVIGFLQAPKNKHTVIQSELSNLSRIGWLRQHGVPQKRGVRYFPGLRYES